MGTLLLECFLKIRIHVADNRFYSVHPVKPNMVDKVIDYGSQYGYEGAYSRRRLCSHPGRRCLQVESVKNGTRGRDTLGINLFNCHSADGYFNGVLRAQGNQNRANFAKQFSADGDLKAIGEWYATISAAVGNIVRVTWNSPTDILIEKL